MNYSEVLILVIFFGGIGGAAWFCWRLLSSHGPSKEQRDAVASHVLRGAKLMGRTSAPRGSNGQVSVSSDKALKGVEGSSRNRDHPSKEDLREAVKEFGLALAIYPNDYSTRYLKAQALEELGELNDALADLNWLVRSKSIVKPGFLRRMAIALGFMDAGGVAPLGTSLVGKCDVDLVVFHLLKRRGRVLLKKRLYNDAKRDLMAAIRVLDQLAWNEEIERRRERVTARTRAMSRHQNKAVTSQTPGEGKIVSGSNGGAEAEGLLGEQKKNRKEQTEAASFKPKKARAGILLLLARCHEAIGNVAAASNALEEACELGSAEVQEDAKTALQLLQGASEKNAKRE